MTDKIEVQNVGQPGKTYRVDAAKYAEMRAAVLAVTPAEPPGIAVAALIEAVKPHLSATHCSPAAKPRAGGSNACNWTLRPRAS